LAWSGGKSVSLVIVTLLAPRASIARRSLVRRNERWAVADPSVLSPYSLSSILDRSI
jgi:hypothetical protein